MPKVWSKDKGPGMTGPISYSKYSTESKVLRMRQFVDASGGISAAEFARNIGVDKSVFYNWCREYGVKLTRRGCHARR